MKVCIYTSHRKPQWLLSVPITAVPLCDSSDLCGNGFSHLKFSVGCDNKLSGIIWNNLGSCWTVSPCHFRCWREPSKACQIYLKMAITVQFIRLSVGCPKAHIGRQAIPLIVWVTVLLLPAARAARASFRVPGQHLQDWGHAVMYTHMNMYIRIHTNNYIGWRHSSGVQCVSTIQDLRFNPQHYRTSLE